MAAVCGPQLNCPRTGCRGRCGACARLSSALVAGPAASTTSGAWATRVPCASITCQSPQSLRCNPATRWPSRTWMPGCASRRSTRRCGRTQPACTCQQAVLSSGKPAVCSVAVGAAWYQSGPGPSSQPGGRPGLPGGRRSSTPLGLQSTPLSSRACDCCSMARTPARETRVNTLSSLERCGPNSPTGRPEAPVAGVSPASITSTRQPRRARLAAVAAPARPAPITRQRAGAARTGRVGGVREVRGSHRGSKVACRLSRLGGTPGTRVTSKPHCASASRTARAMVQVARRVPRRQQRATAFRVCGPSCRGCAGD